MSRTTKSINHINEMLDSISGLTGEASDIMENLEKDIENKVNLINKANEDNELYGTCFDDSKPTICNCFHEKKVKHYLTELEKGICIGQGKMPPEYEYKIESRCSGTRGDEICSCNGDLKKCTHYPENRGSDEI